VLSDIRSKAIEKLCNGFFKEESMVKKFLDKASSVDVKKLNKKLEAVLFPDEIIQFGFKVVRDLFVFTDHRLILIDKQGLTGVKTEYLSIPYRSITHFSIVTAGNFDREAELIIWLEELKIERELKRNVDIIGLQRTLAYFVTK